MLGRLITAGGLRQALQRARDRYVGFLIEEVAGSLASPSVDQLEQELGDLGLLEQCRPTLSRHDLSTFLNRGERRDGD